MAQTRQEKALGVLHEGWPVIRGSASVVYGNEELRTFPMATLFPIFRVPNHGACPRAGSSKSDNSI